MVARGTRDHHSGDPLRVHHVPRRRQEGVIAQQLDVYRATLSARIDERLLQLHVAEEPQRRRKREQQLRQQQQLEQLQQQLQASERELSDRPARLGDSIREEEKEKDEQSPPHDHESDEEGRRDGSQERDSYSYDGGASPPGSIHSETASLPRDLISGTTPTTRCMACSRRLNANDMLYAHASSLDDEEDYDDINNARILHTPRSKLPQRVTSTPSHSRGLLIVKYAKMINTVRSPIAANRMAMSYRSTLSCAC